MSRASCDPTLRGSAGVEMISGAFVAGGLGRSVMRTPEGRMSGSFFSVSVRISRPPNSTTTARPSHCVRERFFPWALSGLGDGVGAGDTGFVRNAQAGLVEVFAGLRRMSVGNGASSCIRGHAFGFQLGDAGLRKLDDIGPAFVGGGRERVVRIGAVDRKDEA